MSFALVLALLAAEPPPQPAVQKPSASMALERPTSLGVLAGFPYGGGLRLAHTFWGVVSVGARLSTLIFWHVAGVDVAVLPLGRWFDVGPFARFGTSLIVGDWVQAPWRLGLHFQGGVEWRSRIGFFLSAGVEHWLAVPNWSRSGFGFELTLGGSW